MSQLLRLATLALVFLVPAAARAADGGLYLYLQPLPAEASRLTLEIASVSAVSGSGAERPLALAFTVVREADGRRQRLLASGRLPEGPYTGLAVTIRRATLRGPDGEVSLAVPEGPVRADVPLTVARRRPVLVWLSLKVPERLAGASALSPAFAAVVPPRPIADHAGFVANTRSNTVTVFDKQIMQAVAVIDTCAGPSGLALDQRRRRLYVACPNVDEIESFDVVAGELIETADASPGDRPRELALSPDGSTLVSANQGSNSLGIYDTGPLRREDRVNVGSGPGAVVVEPAGRRAFVFNTLSNSVSVVDIAGRAVAATLSTEAPPLRGQFNARGDRLYVIHDRSPFMTAFDTQQMTTVARVRLGGPASAIAVDRVRGLICLGSTADTAIEFYDPNVLLPLYTMKTRAGASYLAIVPDDSDLYMVSPDTRSLLVGRLADRKVVSEIDVGDGPCWVAIMGEK